MEEKKEDNFVESVLPFPHFVVQGIRHGGPGSSGKRVLHNELSLALNVILLVLWIFFSTYLRNSYLFF